jgi:hypothetical protein
MAEYITHRIIANAHTYANVIAARPDLKADIDYYLIILDRADLIEE